MPINSKLPCRVRIRVNVVSPMWYKLMEFRAKGDSEQPPDG